LDDTSLTVRLIGSEGPRLFSRTALERARRMFGACDVGDETSPFPVSGLVLLLRADHVLDDVLAKPLVAARDLALTSSDIPSPGGGRCPQGGWGMSKTDTDVVETSPIRRASRATFPLRGKVGIAAIVIDAMRVDEGRVLLDGTPDDCAQAGLEVTTPQDLAGAYRAKLRNRVPPYALSTAVAAPREIERIMYDATYKGITDAVTKYVWPTPAFVVTRWCAAARITPNAVTIVSFLCVLAATALFATGWFLPGLLAAWTMCFLDTVDGKLARVTLTSSKLGDVLDHGTDLLHPPFWWYAWYAGLSPAGLPHMDVAVWIVIAGYVLGRAQEGLFLAAFRFEMFGWRPLDAFSRLITARRNPNLVLLSLAALAGRPDIGLATVAVWTLLCLAFHSVRIVQAFIARAAGQTVTPFLADA
jgi:phosphatidylglycerophosphate synthase